MNIDHIADDGERYLREHPLPFSPIAQHIVWVQKMEWRTNKTFIGLRKNPRILLTQINPLCTILEGDVLKVRIISELMVKSVS